VVHGSAPPNSVLGSRFGGPRWRANRMQPCPAWIASPQHGRVPPVDEIDPQPRRPRPPPRPRRRRARWQLGWPGHCRLVSRDERPRVVETACRTNADRQPHEATRTRAGRRSRRAVAGRANQFIRPNLQPSVVAPQMARREGRSPVMLMVTIAVRTGPGPTRRLPTPAGPAGRAIAVVAVARAPPSC